MTIEERLENMEREVRHQKRRNRWLFGAVLVVAGGMVVPAVFETTAFRARAQAGGTVAEIRAKNFVLEDENGKVRGVLAVDKYGSALTLYDENGKARAWLNVGKDGPGLNMNDENGKPRAMLNEGKDGPGLILYDEKNENYAELAVGKERRGLTLSDEYHKPLARLCVDKDGPGLSLFDTNTRFHASLSVNKDNADLSLSEAKGGGKSFRMNSSSLGLFEGVLLTCRAWLGMGKDGQSMQLFDEKGKLRFAAGRTETETSDGKTIAYPESSLLLFGPDGKVIWSAIK
jgi:hypothetical protein